MTFHKFSLGAACLLGVATVQIPAIAQTTSAQDLMLTAQSRQIQDDSTPDLQADSPVEIAQSRRRGASTATSRSADFIGVGASFGYVDDISGVVISKFSIADQWAIRPSVSIGDNLAILVPVTYEFNNFNTEIGGAQVSPYAGLGASWANENNNEGSEKSDLHLLVSAGVDVPVSERFTVNAQANLGLFNDTEFGATVGVGYNFGSIFR